MSVSPISTDKVVIISTPYPQRACHPYNISHLSTLPCLQPSPLIIATPIPSSPSLPPSLDSPPPSCNNNNHQRKTTTHDPNVHQSSLHTRQRHRNTPSQPLPTMTPIQTVSAASLAQKPWSSHTTHFPNPSSTAPTHPPQRSQAEQHVTTANNIGPHAPSSSTPLLPPPASRTEPNAYRRGGHRPPYH